MIGVSYRRNALTEEIDISLFVLELTGGNFLNLFYARSVQKTASNFLIHTSHHRHSLTFHWLGC